MTIQIAVPLDAPSREVCDALSSLLSEMGTEREGSLILDWRHVDHGKWATLADDVPQEGEIFFGNNFFRVESLQ